MIRWVRAPAAESEDEFGPGNPPGGRRGQTLHASMCASSPPTPASN